MKILNLIALQIIILVCFSAFSPQLSVAAKPVKLLCGVWAYGFEEVLFENVCQGCVTKSGRYGHLKWQETKESFKGVGEAGINDTTLILPIQVFAGVATWEINNQYTILIDRTTGKLQVSHDWDKVQEEGVPTSTRLYQSRNLQYTENRHFSNPNSERGECTVATKKF